MSLENGRYTGAGSPVVADGWTLKRVTPPSRLYGANGLRTGPDGRIYVAQVTGSQISALDLGTGGLEVISAKGGDIISPDDVAFDPQGNLYATEVMEGRVSTRGADGRTRVLRDDLPCANGITVHQGRLFINECRIGGRLMELRLDGGAPRVLLENIPMPNAMEVGPDGLLYFPVMATGEIWRIGLDGGAPETVTRGLAYPDAVKFDPKGHIVSTQAATGEVLRIDPRSGERSVLAKLDPGLDNCTFVGDRLFVSNFTGEITEVRAGGETRMVLPGGFSWPLDLAVSDGSLYIADGTHLFQLVSGDTLRTVGMMFSPGYPGVVRGLAAVGGGEFIATNTNGQVWRYRPDRTENEVLAQGLDPQLYGVAVAPGGAVVVAELGAGRVSSIQSGKVDTLASGLREPTGVAFAADGACLVSEAGAGRVVKLKESGGVETLVDGLKRPQGILVRDGLLYVVDAGAKALIAFDLKTKTRSTIASSLPVGPAPGVTPKPLRGMAPFSGPQGPFAGIAAGPDGTLYVSADGEGSVLALRKAKA
jgi:sugar lactone lactonase YvrE